MEGAHPLVETTFAIRFWGVRGSIACPGPDTIRYGGNTSCVEVRCGNHLLVLDGGTGLRPLGQELVRQGHPLNLDLFYSHTHLDHVSGLPFFQPAYNPGNHIRIWAGHLKPHHLTIEEVLGKMMSAPLFPVPLDVFAAQIKFKNFAAGEVLKPHRGIVLRTGALNHPNGATGYRVEYAGKSVAYITDTEHRDDSLDDSVLKLVDRADVMIYDSMYTDTEYPAHRDWGHSTWEEAVRIAEAANVRRLVLFHHDPSHDDDFMDRIAAEAARIRPGTMVASEGLVLKP